MQASRMKRSVIPAALLFLFASPERAAAQSAPIAAYAFSETSGTSVADLSGHGNTGTLLNPLTWAAGRVGGGVAGSTTDGSVSLPGAATLTLSTALTFETWFYPTAGGHHVIWSQGTPGARYWLYLQAGDSRLTFQADTSAGSQWVQWPAPFPLNVWSHVAVAYDGSTLTLFVNGAAVAARAATGTLPEASSARVVGSGLRGTIDEVRIYGRALSAAEVALDMVTPVDAAAPFQITRMTPAPAALGVLTTPITAAFGRAVNGATVTPATFALYDAAETLVPS
ncbi:MAG: LamG domain-containing protein, partial [Acidobacteria bacterium]|nr:LamG domain-containing protein [Acidobacteriota bacterium]